MSSVLFEMFTFEKMEKVRTFPEWFNPEVVATIMKWLKNKYAHLNWWERRKLTVAIHSLKVVKVRLFCETVDHHDGKESIYVSHTTEDG